MSPYSQMDEETLPKVIHIVKAQFVGENRAHFSSELTTSSTKISEYHPDQLDYLELVMALEEEFGMEITDNEAEEIQENDMDCRDLAEFIAKKSGAP